jgi:hypothetical protein
MQPPFAAASVRCSRLTAANGKALAKEEDERRNQQSLPEMLALKPDHERDQVEPVRFRFRDQPVQIAGIVLHVGISEQDTRRVRHPFEAASEPFGHCPQLARPACRQRARADHLEQAARSGRDSFGNRPSMILAVVVDQHHAEPTGIVLGEQRAQRASDVGRLVAGRHDRDTSGNRCRDGTAGSGSDSARQKAPRAKIR